MAFFSLILSFLAFLLSPLSALLRPASLRGEPAPPPVTRQIVTPKFSFPAASPSANLPVSNPPYPSQPSTPWGQTEKLGEHLYRTYVSNDPVMGTPAEILSALNSYRESHGQGQLQTDDKLCQLANWRAQTQNKEGNIDEHRGLIEYMNNPDHWKELNITAIGENASYGYVLSGVHLIEWVFDADAEHRANQLNPNWNLSCAGVNGITVDIIFGKR